MARVGDECLAVNVSFVHQNLYESIKNEPFKIPEDDGNDLTHTFFNPDREGWLLKLGETAWGALMGGGRYPVWLWVGR